ncbi:hypothetical protein Q7P37_006671 [Cladosporium fusiforme]
MAKSVVMRPEIVHCEELEPDPELADDDSLVEFTDLQGITFNIAVRDILPGWLTTVAFVNALRRPLNLDSSYKINAICVRDEEQNDLIDYTVTDLLESVSVQDSKPMNDTFFEQSGIPINEVPEGYDEGSSAMRSNRATNEAMDACLSGVRPKWDNVQEAQEHIRSILEPECPLLTRLPSGPSTSAITATPQGELHFPHQVIFVAWVLWQRTKFRGRICMDQMGMGKTHEAISLIQATVAYNSLVLARPADRPERPTLVVVPTLIFQKWYKDLNNHLGKLVVIP